MPQALADQVYDERLTLNPGAEELIGACKRAGLYCLLATGGFTCYTDRLRQRLGLDDVRANVLETRDGRLTGRLLPQPWGDICDGEERRTSCWRSARGWAWRPSRRSPWATAPTTCP